MDDKSIIPADSTDSAGKPPCGCKGLVVVASAGTGGGVALPTCPNDGVNYVLHCFNGTVAWVRA